MCIRERTHKEITTFYPPLHILTVELQIFSDIINLNEPCSLKALCSKLDGPLDLSNLTHTLIGRKIKVHGVYIYIAEAYKISKMSLKPMQIKTADLICNLETFNCT